MNANTNLETLNVTSFSANEHLRCNVSCHDDSHQSFFNTFFSNRPLQKLPRDAIKSLFKIYKDEEQVFLPRSKLLKSCRIIKIACCVFATHKSNEKSVHCKCYAKLWCRYPHHLTIETSLVFL